MCPRTRAQDRTIRLWNPDTGRLIRTLGRNGNQDPQVGPAETVRNIVFSSDGSFIVSGASLHIHTWETATGQLLNAFVDDVLVEDDAYIYGLAISATDSLIFSGSIDGSIRRWNANDGTLIDVMANFEDGVLSLSLSPR